MNANKKLSLKIQQAEKFIQENSLSEEQWRPLLPVIGGHAYYISSKGRVLSLCREQPSILKPQLTGSHYYYVKINGKNRRIHKLVAAAFLTKPGTGVYDIHHIDGNALNNAAENLIYLTKEEHKEIHRQKNAAAAAALKPRGSSSQNKKL